MILVTGATGFTGSFVVKRLKQEKFEMACFVRPSSDTTQLKSMGVELRIGDLDDYESFLRALEGIDVLVNIASLGFGHAPAIVKACEEAGVKRAVFISTTALFTSLNAKSKSIRMAAEQTIMSSDLDYTILRPTMIYGTERDRNMSRLIRFINRSPIVPVLGSGKYLQQPVYVEDVAEAVLKALVTPRAVRQAYNIAGAAPLNYDDVIHEICAALEKERVIVHIPLRISLMVVTLLAWIPGVPKIKTEQVLRLNEDKAFSIEKARQELGYNPMTFQEGIRREIARLRSIGLL